MRIPDQLVASVSWRLNHEVIFMMLDHLSKVFNGASSLSISIIGTAVTLRRLWSNTHSRNERFSSGAVLAKFDPPNASHAVVIESAVKLCDSVTVFVWCTTTDLVEPQLRADWIKSVHPSVQVELVHDFTNPLLESIQAFFVSEHWQKPVWNQNRTKNSQLILVNGLSDTNETLDDYLSVGNVYRFFEYLYPGARRHFAKVVFMVGGKATGKTVLANRLAMYYFGSTLVPDLFKEVFTKYQNGTLSKQELQKGIKLAGETQGKLISDARDTSPLVFVDTVSASSAMWCRRLLGDKVDEISFESEVPALNFLCTIEGISNDESLRLGDHDDREREWMEHNLMISLSQATIARLVGSFEQRFQLGIAEINKRFPDVSKCFHSK